MGGNNSQINRFPLPDNWTVDEFICMTVAIPNDPQYIAMMRGLLETLTWQRSFKLHQTELAALAVSKTWAAAFASRQITFGECDMPDFRIDPDTCLLEVNCSSDPESTDWQPVFTSEYDPGRDAPHETLYPDGVAEGQSVPCISAANTVAMLTNGATNFSNLLELETIFGTIVAFLYTFLSSVVTVTLSQLWLGLGVQYGAFDAETFASDLAGFEWNDLLCLLNEHYALDGTMSGEDWVTVLDTMQTNADAPNQIWLWLAMVWGLMGRAGAELATRWGNITEADCADCTETWEHAFDFSIDEQGWVAVQNPYVEGESPCEDGSIGYYQTAFGWRPVVTVYGVGSNSYQVHIAIDLPSSRVLTSVDLTTYGIPPNDAIFRDDLCTESAVIAQSSNPQTIDIPDATYSTVIIGIKNGNSDTAIFAVTLHGIGNDPF